MQGENLLGRKAEDLFELREGKQPEFSAVLSAAQFSERSMMLRSNTSYAACPPAVLHCLSYLSYHNFQLQPSGLSGRRCQAYAPLRELPMSQAIWLYTLRLPSPVKTFPLRCG